MTRVPCLHYPVCEPGADNFCATFYAICDDVSFHPNSTLCSFINFLLHFFFGGGGAKLLMAPLRLKTRGPWPPDPLCRRPWPEPTMSPGRVFHLRILQNDACVCGPSYSYSGSCVIPIFWSCIFHGYPAFLILYFSHHWPYIFRSHILAPLPALLGRGALCLIVKGAD